MLTIVSVVDDMDSMDFIANSEQPLVQTIYIYLWFQKDYRIFLSSRISLNTKILRWLIDWTAPDEQRVYFVFKWKRCFELFQGKRGQILDVWPSVLDELKPQTKLTTAATVLNTNMTLVLITRCINVFIYCKNDECVYP